MLAILTLYNNRMPPLTLVFFLVRNEGGSSKEIADTTHSLFVKKLVTTSASRSQFSCSDHQNLVDLILESLPILFQFDFGLPTPC